MRPPTCDAVPNSSQEDLHSSHPRRSDGSSPCSLSALTQSLRSQRACVPELAFTVPLIQARLPRPIRGSPSLWPLRYLGYYGATMRPEWGHPRNCEDAAEEGIFGLPPFGGGYDLPTSWAQVHARRRGRFTPRSLQRALARSVAMTNARFGLPCRRPRPDYTTSPSTCCGSTAATPSLGVSLPSSHPPSGATRSRPHLSTPAYTRGGATPRTSIFPTRRTALDCRSSVPRLIRPRD